MVKAGCLAAAMCVVAPSVAAGGFGATELAECGYLSHRLVMEMQGRNDLGAAYNNAVRDVIDFTNLYYIVDGRPRPTAGPRITSQMLTRITQVGSRVHHARVRAMDDANALKLSNTVLATCQSDLNLFGQKIANR